MVKGKYSFYDAVLRSRLARSKSRPLVFEGNTLPEQENEKRLADIFGGRLTGQKASKNSSRYFSNDLFHIAGVTVPMRPTEPDNCCMSGCVNCVWELYNDDLKEYKTQRKLAAEALRRKGGIWPLKYDPPVKLLDKKNLPEEIRGKSEAEIADYIQQQEALESEDRWESVSMRQFAEFEKRLAAKRK